jgi:Kef-type K+ transport system membrane component KefB
VEVTFVNLLGVVAIAFAVPFALGFFPRIRIPSVVVELVAGILVGPAVTPTTLALGAVDVTRAVAQSQLA